MTSATLVSRYMRSVSMKTGRCKGGWVLFHSQANVFLRKQQNEWAMDTITWCAHHVKRITRQTHLEVFGGNNSVAVICFGHQVIIEVLSVPALNSQKTAQVTARVGLSTVTRHTQRSNTTHNQHHMPRIMTPPINQHRIAANVRQSTQPTTGASYLLSNDCFMLSKCSGSQAAK
jgi:hypothetical protein